MTRHAPLSITCILLATALVAMTPACSDDPSGPEEPDAPNVAVESSRREVATIGPGGGSVSTVSNAGIAYTLDVPPGALLADVEISIAPVTAIKGLPFGGGLVGAVTLSPPGLVLLSPAQLTIGAVTTPAFGQRLVGFGWEGDARSIDLTAAGNDGDETKLLVSHFSGAGAALAKPDDLDLSICDEITPGQPPLRTIATCGDGRDDFFGVMRAQYGYIAQELQIRSGDGLQEAIAWYAEWMAIVHWAGRGARPDVADAASVLSDEISQGNQLATTKILAGVDETKAVCDAANLQWLAEFCEYRALAHAVFTESGVPTDLSDETLMEGICATAVLQGSSLADPLPFDLDRSLDLDFALDIDGTLADARFAVTVADPDNRVGTPSGRTDEQGRYTTLVRRLIAEGAVFDVDAILLLPLFHDGQTGGQGLAQIPITVNEQISRGGDPRVSVEFPAYAIAGYPTPMTVRVEQLTHSGYQPVEGADVTFVVGGGTANPNPAVTTTEGIATTSVTASGDESALGVEVRVEKNGAQLGGELVQAPILSEGILFVSRSSYTTVSNATREDGCTWSYRAPQFVNYTGDDAITLIEGSEATCRASANAPWVLENSLVTCESDPGIRPDGRSAVITCNTDGVLVAASQGATIASPFGRGGMTLRFDVAGGSMQFVADMTHVPSAASGTRWVYLKNTDTQADVFRWTESGPDNMHVVGDLPPGRYEAGFFAEGTISAPAFSNAEATWRTNATITLSPGAAPSRVTN